ncbi:uncharacterized protein LOC116346285 [Contarinia nasturtii]|uniref:uncharacterized protein LOC116346285 n=1 Tax=Contarinia nasturtii TaxID=265458 RepID=UPI0012D45D7C|nr:uncharacterized protein LOC116346285 [Contarinia nasturtii]
MLALLEDKLKELESAGKGINLKDPHLREVKDFLQNVADKVRQKIKTETNNRAISLLCDIVTKRGRSIFGVSLQYIVGGKVTIRSIGMIELKDRHTGAYLAELTTKRLNDFDIDLPQIITITTDNGSNVLKMIRDIETHLQCAIDDAKSGKEQLVQTPVTSNLQNDCFGNSEAIIDIQIEAALAEAEDATDDELLKILFNETDEPSDATLNSKQTLLSAISSSLTSNHSMDVMWDITGVNCGAHTLQLMTNDGIKIMKLSHRNVIDLTHRVALFLRKSTTIYEMHQKEYAYKKPRIDVETRWCSKYIMMRDVYECRKIIDILARQNNIEICKLLLQKWAILKEIIIILQVPYKATVALQSHSISLSDSYGIWLKLQIHLEILATKKFKTSLAKHLLDQYKMRKAVIFNNPAMMSALYLDPRFRIGSDLNVSIDFNNACPLDIYLSRNDTSQNLSLNTYLAQNETVANVVNMNQDIENAIDSFNPPKMASDASILDYWESQRTSNEQLYQLAITIFAIPPTEVMIERDFSHLEFILSNRRCSLGENILEDILLIHLNRDFFYDIKKGMLTNIK